MISDEERREVAARLREVNPYRNQSHTIPYHLYTPAVEYLSELAGALGYSPRNDVSRLEFQNRLADLIEPEPERTCRDTSPMSYKFTCSECHSSYRFGSEHKVWYCPYCGAKVVKE